MAWVLLGGLVTSTVLSVLVLPVLYVQLPQSWVSTPQFPVQRHEPEKGTTDAPAGEPAGAGVVGQQSGTTSREPVS
jgi:hypothetical protein